MRGPFMVWRFRFSSLALGMAILFAVGGLYAMDRALSDSVRRQAVTDAVESAALVQGFLSVHAEALQSVHGLYLASSGVPQDSAFDVLIRALGTYAVGFDRVLVTDTLGDLVHGVVLASDATGTASAAASAVSELDSAEGPAIRAAMERVRMGHGVSVVWVGPFLGDAESFALLEPIRVGPRFVGFVVGLITTGALMRSLDVRRPQTATQLALIVGRDTIVEGHGPGVRGAWQVLASAPVTVPGGTSWRVVVARTAPHESARLVLWGVGLVTLTALVVALLHERHQGVRLAERSAELERLSQELLRANRAKSEFLANVSHELRTPLNAIVGFVDLLRDGVYGELTPRQIGPVERMASSATHLRQLVDQILDLAKMAAGRLEVHLEMVDLRPLVLDTASEVESLVSEHGLNLSIAVPASLPRIRTDAMHVRQILVNLLGNAVKFTRSGGIAVRARVVPEAEAIEKGARPGGSTRSPLTRRHAWVSLQVADSGVGIAPSDRERIFEEFEQVNAGPRGDSARRGTGLGLPISRRLARLLGGDLTVESEVGKGSTFTVWLPLEDVSESGQEARREEVHEALLPAVELGTGPLRT